MISSRTPRRAGSVLVVALVVITLLALGGYAFLDQMRLRFASAIHTVDASASRRAAEAGVEYTLALFDAPEQLGNLGVEDRSDLFANIAVGTAATGEADVPTFEVISLPRFDDPTGVIRHGLASESGKLNLHLLAAIDDEETARQMLLFLPMVDEFIADAILDWIDEDDVPRDFGAELEYYSTLMPPLTPINRVPYAPDELVGIRDLTPELIFGEDLNRNGRLDPNEDDGELTPPNDNADGMLTPGLLDFITIDSRESTRNALGEPLLDLNSPDLATLYAELQTVLALHEAQFIIAYRVLGASHTTPSLDNPAFALRTTPAAEGALDAVIDQLLEAPPKTEITSLSHLIDATVSLGGGRSRQMILSPWVSTTDSLTSAFPTLVQNAVTSSDASRPGRIDINRCPREVLLGLPDITEEQAEAIVLTQPLPGLAGSEDSTVTVEETVARLLVTFPDVFSPSDLRGWSSFVSVGGAAYQCQVIGRGKPGSPPSRFEVVIDAASVPARVVRMTDLTDLGWSPDPIATAVPLGTTVTQPRATGR